MEDKKTKIIGIIAIVALALTIITATYAYFAAQTGDPAAADIKINANTVDTFTFSTGSEITLNLDQENFASGKGNITGSTYASALLTANNKTNTATDNYYVYLEITGNTFTYSINESTPEIIMTVTDSNGTEITDISTLNHVIASDANGTQISGYDITNKIGLITLFNNREITATPQKEEKWNITITFVNYDKDQSKNAGKSFDSKVKIQKNEYIISLETVCSNGQPLNECIKSMYGKDTTLYLHNGSIKDTNGKILDANDGSYRYAGSNYCLYNGQEMFKYANVDNACDAVYKIVEYDETVYYDKSFENFYDLDKTYDVEWDSTTSKCIVKGSSSEADICGSTVTEEKCVGPAYYAPVWDSYYLGIEKLDSSKVTSGGVQINNYVKINDNLYRIIGVFEDKVKLIKDTAYGDTVAWDVNNSNDWSTASLNNILNTTFLNNNLTSIVSKIENHKWSTYVTKSWLDDIPKELNNLEKTATKFYTGKIGLIYPSDYGYASSVSDWTKKMNDDWDDYSKNHNWMWNGIDEWSIIGKGTESSVFTWDDYGYLDGASANDQNYTYARPSFYLTSDALYVSGLGTKESPIIIN